MPRSRVGRYRAFGKTAGSVDRTGGRIAGLSAVAKKEELLGILKQERVADQAGMISQSLELMSNLYEVGKSRKEFEGAIADVKQTAKGRGIDIEQVDKKPWEPEEWILKEKDKEDISIGKSDILAYAEKSESSKLWEALGGQDDMDALIKAMKTRTADITGQTEEIRDEITGLKGVGEDVQDVVGQGFSPYGVGSVEVVKTAPTVTAPTVADPIVADPIVADETVPDSLQVETGSEFMPGQRPKTPLGTDIPLSIGRRRDEPTVVTTSAGSEEDFSVVSETGDDTGEDYLGNLSNQLGRITANIAGGGPPVPVERDPSLVPPGPGEGQLGGGKETIVTDQERAMQDVLKVLEREGTGVDPLDPFDLDATREVGTGEGGDDMYDFKRTPFTFPSKDSPTTAMTTAEMAREKAIQYTMNVEGSVTDDEGMFIPYYDEVGGAWTRGSGENIGKNTDIFRTGEKSTDPTTGQETWVGSSWSQTPEQARNVLEAKLDESFKKAEQYVTHYYQGGKDSYGMNWEATGVQWTELSEEQKWGITDYFYNLGETKMFSGEAFKTTMGMYIRGEPIVGKGYHKRFGGQGENRRELTRRNRLWAEEYGF